MSSADIIQTVKIYDDDFMNSSINILTDLAK